MNFHFSAEQLRDFPSNAKREWAMTNGIGGYAGGCILGSLNRTHQGYLIASLHPPVERYLVLSKTNEKFICADREYNLETAQHAGEALDTTVVASDDVPDVYGSEEGMFVASDFVARKPIYTEGQRYFDGFDYDGNVHFHYCCDGLRLDKHLTLVRGENRVAVAYRITNPGAACDFIITPLFQFREHSASSTRESLKFKVNPLCGGCGLDLIPEADPTLCIRLLTSEGSLVVSASFYDEDLQFATEVENEVPGLDTCYTPYQIRIHIPEHSTKDVTLLCALTPVTETASTPAFPESRDAFRILEENTAYHESLIQKAGYQDSFADALVLATDQFLSYRASTGLTTVLAGLPWFTDWGRDTMIAFTGLVLATGRFEKAREILLTFAQYLSNGMVPNMFPDNGQDPLYNTVDASLWYFYAVDRYLAYDPSPEAYEFIHREIFPALKEIIRAYHDGTSFSIYMDSDGLIHAGSGVDQVTWMDVRVGDWVVTPRHGKPVEISALWYNALKVMENLTAHFKEEEVLPYEPLSTLVKTSFREKFWNPKEHCLYDVIDDHDGICDRDPSIRPNQIWAVSLPYTMLNEMQARSVVDVVKEKLFVGVGLRSLSPEHKDYHPIYVGSLPKRDAAYHQGTAWGFPLGGFITAYTKVYGPSAKTAADCLAMIEPVQAHLRENCIGSICEIFDGDAPHLGRGCYAQAWSVGEVLRCYTEDILPYLDRNSDRNPDENPN